MVVPLSAPVVGTRRTRPEDLVAPLSAPVVGTRCWHPLSAQRVPTTGQPFNDINGLLGIDLPPKRFAVFWALLDPVFGKIVIYDYFISGPLVFKLTT